jgi:hypothetical protein
MYVSARRLPKKSARPKYFYFYLRSFVSPKTCFASAATFLTFFFHFFRFFGVAVFWEMAGLKEEPVLLAKLEQLFRSKEQVPIL